MPGFLVIIVSHGRPAWLKRAARSVLEASIPDAAGALELRIGINGNDSKCEQTARELQDRDPKRVQVHSFMPALTPAAARNHLLQGSTQEWVYFLDDDAYVERDHFKRLLRALSRFPAADAVGGPNLTPPESSAFQHAVGIALSSWLATCVSVARYQPRGGTRPCGEESLILCNLFVRARTLGEKPFPEDFFCNEENWFLSGLSARGSLLVHDPELAVFHERRESLPRLMLQSFYYGRGRGRSARRDSTSARWLHYVPSAALLALIGLAIRPTWQLGPLLILYAALCVLAPRLRPRLPDTPWHSPWLASLCFPAIHLAYGTGFLLGLGRRGP